MLKTVDNKVIKTRNVKDTNVISGFLRAEKYFSANVLLGHIDDVVRQGHNGLFYSHKGLSNWLPKNSTLHLNEILVLQSTVQLMSTAMLYVDFNVQKERLFN